MLLAKLYGGKGLDPAERKDLTASPLSLLSLSSLLCYRSLHAVYAAKVIEVAAEGLHAAARVTAAQNRVHHQDSPL